MNDTNNDKAAEELAERSQVFLNGVSRLAEQQQLPRGMILSLFGYFGQRIVDLDEADGIDRDKAMKRAIESFMGGLGVDVTLQQVTPETAALVSAQVEADGRTRQ